MSIIIAKKIDGVIIILSDTKVSIDSGDVSITGGNKLRISPVEGALKSIILFGGICVSYAGNIHEACNIIGSFEKQRFHEFQEILEYLHKEIINSGTDVEFILTCADANWQGIIKITKEEIGSPSESAWIGSHKAFSRFQYLYDQQKENNKDYQQAFKGAFQCLLEEHAIPEIGDFRIETVFNPSRGCCFFYSDSLLSYRGPDIVTIQKNETKILDDGSSAIGSYTVSLLGSNQCNKPALLLFFNHGNFGILYLPKDVLSNDGKGIVIKGESAEAILSEIKMYYDIELDGHYFSNGTINRTNWSI